MNFALAYMVNRFFYRLGNFFHNWYIHGSRRLAHGFITFLESLDKTFAVKITLRNYWRPLYGDYTIIGRILGIIFRTLRVLLGVSVYLICLFAFLAIYAAWLAIPAAVLFYFLYHFVKFR